MADLEGERGREELRDQRAAQAQGAGAHRVAEDRVLGESEGRDQGAVHRQEPRGEEVPATGACCRSV
jgi:hypothetical protein